MLLVIACLGVLLLSSPFTGLTIISISSITVDPQGYEVGGQWTGSFWNIVATVSQSDSLAGVILPEGQEGSVNTDGVLKTLKTGAKIEIKIDPQQPYLYRGLTEKTVKIAPKATGGGLTVDDAWMDYYAWSGGWQIYTPYLVTVYKDGVQVGSAQLDNKGLDTTQIINTNEGTIRIEHLGSLLNNYMSPSFPSEICIVKGATNIYYSKIYDWSTIQSLVDSKTELMGQFDDYWYGSSRTTVNSVVVANNPPTYLGGVLGNTFLPSKYGGWGGSDYGGQATPVKPVVLSTQLSALPLDERSFGSATQWLEDTKRVTNWASTIFQSFTSVDFVKDSTGKVSALKMFIPWSGYATPMVSIRVPTELADTWVDQPPIAHLVPTATWQSNNGKYISFTNTAILAVSLKQESTVLSSGRVDVTCGNANIGVDPVNMPSVSVAPGGTQIVYFTIRNLGVTEQINNIPITVTCFDKYTGAPTGSDVVYATLLPSTVQEETSLRVLAVVKSDGETVESEPIIGLTVSVEYGGATLSQATDSSGFASFNLETDAGGGYSGPVVVSSVDTEKYVGVTASTTVNYGPNDFKIDVPLKGVVYPETDWSWLAWFALPLTVAVIGFMMLKTMKKRGR